ncbi:hypothetical protein EVAR_33366_1 [Eumeta japonica]|uniref:Uncharacterized protein n=1 Tax=Eumeta variegata TaxID=151549 RepID=A0A4C1X1T5_EUMVA|nr:hypothetical protein EVAR_33366_1 [Eumeta japonica]
MAVFKRVSAGASKSYIFVFKAGRLSAGGVRAFRSEVTSHESSRNPRVAAARQLPLRTSLISAKRASEIVALFRRFLLSRPLGDLFRGSRQIVPARARRRRRARRRAVDTFFERGNTRPNCTRRDLTEMNESNSPCGGLRINDVIAEWAARPPVSAAGESLSADGIHLNFRESSFDKSEISISQ